MTARRNGFAHLHVHTMFSVLDGMTQHDEMCDEVLADAEVSEAEMAAVAVTDHGTLSGTYKFAKAAQKRGVKPLLGCELYLANGLHRGARFEKEGLVVPAEGADFDGDRADGGTGKRKTKKFEHITVIAETRKGWENLIRINNAAHDPDAKWGRPRADIDLLCEYGEGLIVMTGCLGGPVLGSVARGDVDRARTVLRKLSGHFDPDHLFLEIMEHGIPQEAKAMRTMLDLGDEFGLSPVATNDAHFAEPGHAHAHEAWLCNATKSKLADEDRWKFHGEGYWLRSAAEMRAIFDADERTQMACDNTLAIAERVEADVMTRSELRLPSFPLPDGYVPSESARRKGLDGSAAYLNDQIREGAIRRYGSPLPAEVRERLTYEFDVIYSMGLHDYFLIVQDLIAAARREGIRVGPGRGSAAGCAISYCLDIVNIDPIRYNLLFERFLNPERIGMPDIDIDFEASGRDWAFGYLARRYGPDRVARIGNFGYALTKGALRSAARVLSLPSIGDELSSAVPTNKNGKPEEFERFLDPANPSGDEFRRRVAQSADHQAVAELAQSWEGSIDKEGVHACGVIIGRDPLDGELPLRDAKGFPVTQWDGKDLDALQFLKLDALALRNLDVATATERLIAETTGETIDADNPSLDPDDPDPVAAERVRKTFELLQAGKTAGVFQLECVSGDTLVSGRRIADLYAKQEAGDPLQRTRSAYLNEGKWHFNDVIRIVKTGRSVTRRLVTATGRMIEATDGHMFMTENGWKRLDQIEVGENLLVDTRAKQLIHRTCIDCGAWTNPDPHNPSERCYSCSAKHHSNPSKRCSRSAISKAAKATYEAGREPWNKGLDKAGSPVLASNGRKIAAALQGRTWEDTYGPQRAAELRRETSLRMSGENNHMFGVSPPHTNRGFREDLGHFVRSSWEADYARVLAHFDEPYEYEKHRFDVVLPDGTKTTYTPDFYLPNRDQYVEIKGFMRDRDRVKITAFLEQYPNIDFVLVDQVAFAEFEAANRHLVAWECPSVPKSACWEPVSQVLDAGEQDTFDIQMKAPAHNYLANGFVVHNSGGITELCVQVGPTTLDDIAAIVALYRPGPLEAKMEERYALRKNGLETVDYGIFTRDPAEQAQIAKVLDETYGTCLAGDTRVYSLSRGHLVDLRDVKVGELVESVDPDTFEATAGEVLNSASMGERDTFSLRLRSGDRIEATADHLVLTTDGWKCVADLREGDLVGRPSGAMEPESIDDGPTPELAAVLGYLLGDGGLSVGSSVNFSNKDESVLAAYRQAVQVAFPDVVHSERTGDRAVRHLRAGSGSGGGGRANSLTEWLRLVGLKAPAEQWRDGGPTSADKFVPLEFLRARPEVVVRLIAALWDCDGHVSAPGTRYATTYKTISKQLAEDVRFLLLRLGIASHIGTHDYSPGVTAYQVNVCGTGFDEIVGRHLASTEKAHRSAVREQAHPGRASMLPTSMVLDAVRRKGSVRSFYERRGWTRPHARHTTISSGRAAQANSELHDPILTKYLRLHWSPVVSIEPAGRQEVFDIEVAETQNFVANGMVVHNCIFQEQLMRLGDVVAGFGPIERNRLQKAVSKKLQAEMVAVGELFIAGAMAEKVDEDGTVTKPAFRRETAEKVWDAIKGAGNYAFNASHSYAYGWVTYITAYLKANWPTQYGAALLSVTKKADKRHEMLLSLAAEGIEVVAPRINEALVDTTVNAAGQVVIGMNEVRDVSREDAEIIVAARAGGPFTSLSDFAQRCLSPTLEQRVKIGAFEGLIEAGSFDELGPEGRTCRMGMVLIARAIGLRPDLVPFDCEWNHLERARREAHRLGVLVSPNPTKFLAEHIRGANIGGIKPSPLRRADEQKAGDEFTTAAIVSSWSEQSGHWGRRADILLTGTGAAVRATAWDKTLAKIRAIAGTKDGSPMPKVGDLVLVRGKIVMRKARLENENGEMADGEAIAEETAEISVWDIRVVPVPGDHFDVPAGPSGMADHWFVRPDGFVDPEPEDAPDQMAVDGGLPFAAADDEDDDDDDDVAGSVPESAPVAELVAADPDDESNVETDAGDPAVVRPPDRTEVTTFEARFGDVLASAPGVVEMPWAPGEVDTIVVELANGMLGGTSGASMALRHKRPELAGFLTAVVRLQRRPASSTEDIATEIRPLVDEAVAGRPVEVVAYGAQVPRSTWVIPAGDVPGAAAAAWAEMLAAPAEPPIEMADAVAHRPAA